MVLFFSQEVRRFPGLRVFDQADSPSVGSRSEQGWQVPWSPDPPGVHDGKDRRGQGHHQVPDEEGLVSVGGRWQRRHERRRPRPERPSQYQLHGVAAQEALAERPLPPHQVVDGTSPEIVLRADNKPTTFKS